MPNATDVLGDVSRRPGVAATALINIDGLPIDVRGARLDVDAVAALAATLLRHGGHLADALRRPHPHTLVLELGDSLTILAQLDEMTALVVVLDPGTSAGDLLADLHHLRLEQPIPIGGAR